MNRLLLWIAQGLGIGRIPFAPGTFGSVGGLFWFALLLQTKSWAGFLSGIIAGLGLSVWTCGIGESLLHKKDPGSVVMDEVAAMPVCFIAWVAEAAWKTRAWPDVNYFLSHWPLVAGVFLAFRLFDIAKPWPVRQSQSLPGGWGITVDDVLAAVYVNLSFLTALWLAGERIWN